ncbi:MAG: DUF4416 family protein [Syntrophobacterales bacterium]|nr:MAG: DUF4416 family protein [Syntrophobacterales bacterium]
MSEPKIPDPVKLVSSIFSRETVLLKEVVRELSGKFGGIDFISEYMPFEYTDYYDKEMGDLLVRRFISFEDLVDPEVLPDVKLYTNKIEKDLSSGRKRQVNIDPGYLSEGHLLLATGKRYAHRPYLRDGIYADLTLIYRRGAFWPLEWTYPDYAGESIIKTLGHIRMGYLMRLAEIKEDRNKK